jgi:hypothetical protein
MSRQQNGHAVANKQSADGHTVYSADRSVEKQPVRKQELSSLSRSQPTNQTLTCQSFSQKDRQVCN